MQMGHSLAGRWAVINLGSAASMKRRYGASDAVYAASASMSSTARF
jgi:hypothetical protein